MYCDCSQLRSSQYFAIADQHRVESIVFNDFMGIRRRYRPRIIPQPWPSRLVWDHRNDRPAQREYNRWVGCARPEIQYWIEWRKFADVSPEEYIQWTTGRSIEDQADGLSEDLDLADVRVRGDETWVDAEKFFEDEDAREALNNMDFSWLGKESERKEEKQSRGKKANKGKSKAGK